MSEPNEEHRLEHDAAARRTRDQKLGQFVSNKWLISTLLLLVMSMGGYIFKGIDRSSEVQASQLAEARKILDRHDVEIAVLQATIAQRFEHVDDRFNEVINRLDRIDHVQRRAAGLSFDSSSMTPPAAKPRTSVGVWPNCTESQEPIRAANGEWFCRTRR